LSRNDSVESNNVLPAFPELVSQTHSELLELAKDLGDCLRHAFNIHIWKELGKRWDAIDGPVRS
jgi:hypothetical protein